MKKISTDKSAFLWKKRSEYAKDDFSKVLWPDRPVWNRYYDEWQSYYLNQYISMIKNEDTVLDVGCGIGRWTLRIAPKCKTIYGIDISEVNIETAKKRAEVSNINNAIFQVMDFREIEKNFNENRFDFIFSVGALCCITNIHEFKRVVQVLLSILKIGGYFILLENTIKGENYLSISIDKWLSIIEQEGGKVVEVYGIDNPLLREIFINIPFYRFTKLTTRKNWKIDGETIIERDILLTKLYNEMGQKNKFIEDTLMKILLKFLKPFEYSLPKLFKMFGIIKKSNYYIIVVKKE